jgi:hypothetical protein
MEERIDMLRHFASGLLYDTRTREEVNVCVDRLRELIVLGQELLNMMASAGRDTEIYRLRSWLHADLQRQRVRLKDSSLQGFCGSENPVKH